MNLYDLHKTPESLHRHKDIDTHVAEAFWIKYKDSPEELKKREAAISKSSKYAYLYAKHVLKGRFELGEPAIAKGLWSSYDYALYVLKGRFKLGEPVIAKDLSCSYSYATEVLKSRFELGEKIIATAFNTLSHYNRRFNLNIEHSQ